MAEWLGAINDFHFLRPWWLMAIPPVWLLAWLLLRNQQTAGPWHKVIAPELLPYLLEDNIKPRQHLTIYFAGLFWLLIAIALAGPSWQKISLPIYKQQTPLVILLEVSPSMLAEDVLPNRLTRARLKLTDLLKKRTEGTTALIAFAQDAYVVTPLTDDSTTIISLIPALHPDIMPRSGSNPVKALQRSIDLIAQAGFRKGELLLVSDGVEQQDQEAATNFLENHPTVRLSVLGLGSSEGAPIPVKEGGFLKNRQGEIIVARMFTEPLEKLARNGGGRFVTLSPDDSDINQLTQLFMPKNAETKRQDRQFDTWQDGGFWLILASLPILLLAFRRNLVALVLISPLLLYSESSSAFDWIDLWLTDDQKGQRAYSAGDTVSAEQHFYDPKWKGTAAYRNKNYELASEAFKRDTSATGRYNLGNSLARASQLEDALKAYDAALAIDPTFEDAVFNKNLVEELLRRQETEKQQKGEQQQGRKQQNQNAGQTDSEQDDPDQGDNQAKNQAQKHQGSNTDPEQTEGQQDDNSEQTEAQNQNESVNKKAHHSSNQNTEQNQAAQPEKKANDFVTDMRESDLDLSDEQRQALEQWLRRVPDDPAGLLRRKFQHEAMMRGQKENPSTNDWEDGF